VSAKQLFKGTPYAVVAMFILGALLTPPDFVSQILLAGPMIVLYLLGVGVAWLFDPQRREEREARKAGSEVANRQD
jgi:sec-independent protein translocase protein TatC